MNAVAATQPRHGACGIEGAFRQALIEHAGERGLSIPPEDIVGTFSTINEVAGVATQCYRLRSSRPQSLQLAAAVGSFKRTVPAKHEETGRVFAVHCVLSGLIVGDQFVDWQGEPCDAIG